MMIVRSVSSTLMCKQKMPLLHIPSGGAILQRRPPQQKEKVVVVLGATGAGKSRLSIDLATRFSAEVVNSDKMQVYKGLDIVTNKITDEERCDVPHHLLGVIGDPNKNFTAENFATAAPRIIKSITARGHLPIIAGGSNSFIEALVDENNYCHGQFKSMYEFCFLWVDVSMPVLHAYVSDRVDKMVERGMIEEARKMFNPRNADYSRGLRKAIGVGEFHRYFRTETTTTTSDAAARARLLREALDEVKFNTCELACRQLDKIKRLKSVKGWKLHRVDATEVFRERLGAGAAGGGGVDKMWENLVVEPSAKIVTRFLHHSVGPLIYADVTSIRPLVMGRAMAA